MDITEYRAVAAGHSVLPAVWQATFDDLLDRIAARFRRIEPRLVTRDFLVSLLASVEAKNCWQLAEHAGHASPSRMQRLLREAVWDAEQVQADLRAFVTEHLGHPDAILVADETGFLKKGVCSVGVQRQYCGTAGRIENSQVAVFLAYVTPAGQALIDRRIYLPRSWTTNPDRCAQAGVPDDVEFATKPALALEMVQAAFRAGVTAKFVTADECYGRDPALRQALQQHGVGYVLAVARNHYTRIDTHLKERVDITESWLSAQAWQRYSCGPGSKGERFYDWAWITVHEPTPGCHSLLIRRNRAGELAFYRCWTPQPVSLPKLIGVAGARWAVEETFQQAKGQVGLDHYQCRGWKPWHRFTILAMLALAVITVTAATLHTAAVVPTTSTTNYGIIALTVPETRRLINALTASTADLAHLLRWSLWRRRHQARAKTSHYKHRAHIESQLTGEP